MAVEPTVMPVEGGLRLRVGTDLTASSVIVQIGDTQATDVAGRSGYLYATAPALAAATYVVSLADGTTVQETGSITYVEDLVVAVQGAVDAYRVALSELADRAEAATDDQDREKALADQTLRANEVDNTIAARAVASGLDLDQTEITDIWNSVASTLKSLQEQIAGQPTS